MTNTGFKPFLDAMQGNDNANPNVPVSREEFNALREDFFKLAKTVEGIQQLLGKAAEYQGKPRGRLPR